MKKFYWIVFHFTISFDFYAQIPVLLKDIYPGASTGLAPNHVGVRFADVNGILFFSADNGVNGFELWKSDGTAVGTDLVKDIYPGATSGGPIAIAKFGGKALFSAYDPVKGAELWISDGTASGTYLLKDINPYGNGDPSDFFELNGTAFFYALAGSNRGLWKTDGTTAGTVLVKNFGNTFYPSGFTNLNGILFFICGTGLWKSDGTDAGTVLVKQFVSITNNITSLNGFLYFTARDAASGAELWKSDGTEAGTVMIKDIDPGSGSSNPTWLTELNGALIFSANNAATGNELWKTDGTEQGTVLVRDINAGSANSNLSALINLNGSVFFTADDPIAGRSFWKTNGTEAGTIRIKVIRPTFNFYASPKAVTANNKVYFYDCEPGTLIYDLWNSDGTAEGTVRLLQNIKDLSWLIPSGLKLFVSVTTTALGRELWVADLNASLPLTLLDFKAQLSGNDGLLNWKTSSEQNTSHFEIERSTDGRFFTKAGTVAAAGNSSIEKQYTCTDRNIKGLNAPVIYYRLKMLDIDGKYTYSKIIAININNKEAVVILYPNPVRENATLMISVTKKENITYCIIDASGKTVQQKNITVNEGSNTILVETNSLAAGIYTIALNGANTNRQIRFVKE